MTESTKDTESWIWFWFLVNKFKNLGMLPKSRWWYWVFATSTVCLPPCCLQRYSHYHIKETTNIQSTDLDDGNNNFLFWLKACLFGGWAETSFVFCSLCAKNLLKITLYKTGNTQALIWHIMGKAIFLVKGLFDIKSCFSAGGS